MDNNWRTPQGKPELNQGEVHLWRALQGKSLPGDEQILSPYELQRMHRFRFEKDRRMYLFSHALLRKLLADYINLLPEAIEYQFSSYGKPFLIVDNQQDKYEFNLSHSGGLALIGICKGGPIGVDVEKIKPLPDMDQIAVQYFSTGEQSDLKSLSGSTKLTAYYHCWTRKEAVIKASGEGLSMPLDSFRVSLLPDEPARLIESLDRRKWTLLDLNPTKGYTAAAAVPIPILQAVQFSADGI